MEPEQVWHVAVCLLTLCQGYYTSFDAWWQTAACTYMALENESGRLDLESNLHTVLICTRSGGKALVVKRKEEFCLFLFSSLPVFLSFTFYFLLLWRSHTVHMEVTEELEELASLPLCGFRGVNSGCLSLQPVP